MNKQRMTQVELDEAVFDNLYIDEDDELYPNIRKALGRIRTKMQRRERHFSEAVNKVKEDFEYQKRNVTTGRLRHRSV